jgi:hypothetical protein
MRPLCCLLPAAACVQQPAAKSLIDAPACCTRPRTPRPGSPAHLEHPCTRSCLAVSGHLCATGTCQVSYKCRCLLHVPVHPAPSAQRHPRTLSTPARAPALLSAATCVQQAAVNCLIDVAACCTRPRTPRPGSPAHLEHPRTRPYLVVSCPLCATGSCKLSYRCPCLLHAPTHLQVTISS